VIHICGPTAKIATKKRQSLDVIEEAITAIRREVRVTHQGVEIVPQPVWLGSEDDKLTITCNLVPRVVQTLIEAGTTVTLVCGSKSRTEVPDGIRRRGIVAAAWKDGVRRDAGGMRSGQFAVWRAQSAFEIATQLVRNCTDLNWLFVVKDRDNVRCAREYFDKHLGVRTRVGAGIWQQSPLQAIVTAKDAPLEFAHNDFQQMFVLDACCLLTASSRQYYDLVRCPTLLFRQCGRRYSASEELLLERLAGPVILDERPSQCDQTVILRCTAEEATHARRRCDTPEELVMFLHRLTDKLPDVFDELLIDESLPACPTTVVVGEDWIVDDYTDHLAKLNKQHPRQQLRLVSLNQISLDGVPSGLIVFWQHTKYWLENRDPLRFRGHGLRVIVDPFAVENSRYENHELTTVELTL
jgi:hypothetical protein